MQDVSPWSGVATSSDRVLTPQHYHVPFISCAEGIVIYCLVSTLTFFFFNFESMFFEAGDSSTRKGLGQKKPQERA